MLGAECGNGSFTNINSDAKVEEIPTPYDSVLFSLNTKLNGTYIAYGYAGKANYAAQANADVLNTTMSKSVGLKRVAVKSQSQLYKNDSWDLVDRGGVEKSDEFLKTLDKKTLPDSLQKKTNEELKKVIAVKQQERTNIQKMIETTNTQRDAYIVAEKKKNAANVKEATLETEVEKIIKEQVKRNKMKIE